jgi:hypothetical protein
VLGERRLAREDLAQDGAQPEHVAALVEAVHLAARLLGRHVGRRAQGLPGVGLAPRGVTPQRADGGERGLRVLCGPVAVAGAEHLGQAPVHDLHLPEIPHHHVGRLQVAV